MSFDDNESGSGKYTRVGQPEKSGSFSYGSPSSLSSASSENPSAFSKESVVSLTPKSQVNGSLTASSEFSQSDHRTQIVGSSQSELPPTVGNSPSENDQSELPTIARYISPSVRGTHVEQEKAELQTTESPLAESPPGDDSPLVYRTAFPSEVMVYAGEKTNPTWSFIFQPTHCV